MAKIKKGAGYIIQPFLIIVLTTSSISLLSSSLSFAELKFAVIGDTRSNDKDGINLRVMNLLLNRIEALSVNFIIITGDMTTPSRDVHRTIKKLKKWKDILNQFNIPFYIVIGNHEVPFDFSEEIIRSIFEMPENGPPALKELVYSFDWEGTHFVIIDTNIYNNFHRLGDPQRLWLEDDLKQNQGRPIFVFGHEPAYPVGRHKGSSLDSFPADRDWLWNLFKRYNVLAYFCSHEHVYNFSQFSGIAQIISGGGGAPLHASFQEGGFYHFILVESKENTRFEVSVIDIDGKIVARHTLVGYK